jgi:hypothetical protein
MLIDCQTCQARVKAKEIGNYQYMRQNENPSGRYVLLRCNGCGVPVLVQQDNIGNMAEGDIFDDPVPCLAGWRAGERIASAAPSGTLMLNSPRVTWAGLAPVSAPKALPKPATVAKGTPTAH